MGKEIFVSVALSNHLVLSDYRHDEDGDDDKHGFDDDDDAVVFNEEAGDDDVDDDDDGTKDVSRGNVSLILTSHTPFNLLLSVSR